MERLSLDGAWEIEIAGRQGTVQVPGAWEVQGFPDVEGPAIYRRLIHVPEGWRGAQITLSFEAVSYYVEGLVNGVRVGIHEGLWTPFTWDVTDSIRPGEVNTLELVILKAANNGDRFSYHDALVGFIPYVATTFGGVWQGAALLAQRSPGFAAIQISPHIDGTVVVRVSGQGQVNAEITDAGGERVATAVGAAPELVLHVDQARLWTPESPTLYMLRLRHDGGAETTQRFGFRQLHAEGDQLRLNGAPITLRGILSWGWNERTLAPTFSDDEIRTQFRRLREAGFNLYKLCLYVPPERLFEIADEEGMLLWLELPMWLPHLSDHLRAQAAEEYADILDRVQHHPSVVIYSLGCELSAEHADAALLQRLDTIVRERVAGALVCDNSGSGEAYGGLASDLADFSDYHFYCDLHDFTPLCDLFRRDWRPPRPWVFGEFCDSDDYRDPTEILDAGQRPWWRDLMGKEGNLNRWAYVQQEQRIASLQLPVDHQQIMQLSRRQSLLIRKHIVEKVRGRRDIGGYVITGLRDTPASTSGVFDDLGRFKYDETFRDFNDDAVLLLESGRTRRWTHGGDRPYPIDRFNHVGGNRLSLRAVLANTGQPMRDATLTWHLASASGDVIAEGEAAVDPLLSSGRPRELAMIECALPEVEQALACTLTFQLKSAARELHNAWGIWIYPAVTFDDAALYDPAGALDGFDPLPRVDALDMTRVMIVGGYSREAAEFVRAGGRAIVLQTSGGALPVERVPFWRESIKLFYEHPALSAFPHEGFADMQFYHLATDAAFDLSTLTPVLGEAQVQPILRRLDARLFTALEYLVEARLGQGRMLLSTLRFQGGLGDQVRGLQANTAGAFLLRQMIDYLHAS